MTLVLLALLALGGEADAPGPEALAARLESDREAERLEAEDALEALGLGALPALRKAWAEAGPEGRRRILGLMDEIGDRRLLRPSRVTLDLHDRPLADAVDALAAASGFPIALTPAGDPSWRDRRVTLTAPRPIGFWEALDRLGEAGRVRLDRAPTVAGQAPPSLRPLGLFDGGGTLPPTSYAGPYRLVLTGLHRHRRVDQVRPPAEATVRESFFATLRLVAEPGVLIGRNGPIRVLEAVDDRGGIFRPASPGDARWDIDPFRRWQGRGAAEGVATIEDQLPLELPAEPGGRIARLRGDVPITAVARTDEVLSFPLEGSEGRSFSGGGIVVTVVKVQGSPRPASFSLSVAGEPTPEPATFAAGPRQATLAHLRLPYRPADHIQIDDDRGRPYPLTANLAPALGADGPLQFTVTVLLSPTLGPPARLRYFGVAGVATEVPFDFADLPMP